MHFERSTNVRAEQLPDAGSSASFASDETGADHERCD